MGYLDNEGLVHLWGKIKECVGANQESGFQVGDILATYRTDLGDNWLLCNGEIFDPDEYPELAKKVPALPTGIELKQVRTLPNINTSRARFGPQYATDGKYEVIRANVAGSDSKLFRLNYSKDNFKTYEFTEIQGDAASNRKYNSGCVFYVNGYWICVMFNEYATADVARGVCALSTLKNPTYTITEAIRTTAINRIYDIAYYSGKYYMFCKQTGKQAPKILVSSTPDFSEFSVVTPAVPSGVTVTALWTFKRVGNKCAFFMMAANGYIRLILHANTPAATFTYRTFEQSQFSHQMAVSVETEIIPIVYSNGQYVIIGPEYQDSHSIVLFSVGNLSSGAVQTHRYVLDDAYAVQAMNSLACIITRRGFVIMSLRCTSPSGYGIVYGDDILDLNSWSLDYYGTSDISSNTYGSSYESIHHTINLLGSGVTTIPEYFVPLVAPPQSYAYIKAK